MPNLKGEISDSATYWHLMMEYTKEIQITSISLTPKILLRDILP